MNAIPIEIFSSLPTLLHGLILKSHAYLDPGSGSFILQILVAAHFGGLFLIKSYWKKIVNFFRGKSAQEPLEPPAQEDQDQTK